MTTYRQTGKHCQILVTDRTYSKLQRIKTSFELRHIAQVVDLVTRRLPTKDD